jgi:hypothetical protein
MCTGGDSKHTEKINIIVAVFSCFKSGKLDYYEIWIKIS